MSRRAIDSWRFVHMQIGCREEGKKYAMRGLKTPRRSYLRNQGQAAVFAETTENVNKPRSEMMVSDN